jgi:hypothetical protein
VICHVCRHSIRWYHKKVFFVWAKYVVSYKAWMHKECAKYDDRYRKYNRKYGVN